MYILIWLIKAYFLKAYRAGVFVLYSQMNDVGIKLGAAYLFK